MQSGEQIKAEIERALGQRVSEVRLRLALDSAHMGAWERNLLTGVDIWSARQEALFGLSPGAFAATHQSFLQFVHPDDRPIVEQAARCAIEGNGGYHSEYRIILPDGSMRWMAGNGDVVRDADGRATHMVGVTMDVTDQKLAERERAELFVREQLARKEAEEANRLKDEFLAVVSHELRMPLSIIVGWARLLRQEQSESARADTGLGAIEHYAQTMGRLIEDLLDVSRIIRGKLRLEMQPVSPAELIDAALREVAPTALAKEIILKSFIDPEAGLVLADPGRLQQVLWNLMSNAIKFTPQGGSVEVRLARVASQIEVTVSDNGEGISAEFMPHLFERFRQADGSSKRKHGGLGLGLSIVRHLVELHGGTVHVESPGLGFGSMFKVKLPVVTPQVDSEKSPSTVPARFEELELMGADEPVDQLLIAEGASPGVMNPVNPGAAALG